ncbi:MAG: PA14 domain-containing protein, partial [Planctomycetota bacterium]
GLLGSAYGQGTGTIMREVWEGIGGVSVSDLTDNANFPDNPTWADEITSLEQPEGDLGSDFGSRIHGYLHPATSGDYTFWIAADDGCELLLSTDDDPANGVVIAGHNSWTSSRQWDKFPEQQSEPVALEAGGKYYISATFKEGGGGDNCAVAWQGPDSPEQAVIDGAFLSPAAWAAGMLQAKAVVPADGAVDADTTALEWTAGKTAVSHKVYLSADETIDDADLLGETELNIQVAVLDPGATYYWRVDEVEADGNVLEGALWSFTTIPLEAHFPSPADAATDIEPTAQLSWTAGKVVIMHDLYFGTDEAAIAARDMTTFKGKLMDTSFDPGELDLFTTYYWAVDQFTPTGTVAGPVWSFSTAEYILVAGDETALNYDNSAEPFVSELALDVPADVTAEGILSDITLKFKGAASSLSVDEATGTYEVAGAGADVWGSADQFHYVYRELTGDATIIAHVPSNGSGSNAWSKGGVMIRQSLEVGSVHSLMAITGGNGGGGAFQWRPVADEGSSSAHDDAAGMAPGYWVKLERVGNAFSGSFSADGETWTQQGDAQTIEMADPVLIGLFVTSHAAGEIRTYTFDKVSIDGNVTADDISADVDSVSGNSAEPVYVALEDAAGNVGVVAYPDPAATRITQWWNMKISLGDFAAQGVDLTAATKLYFGVGTGEAAGAGVVTVDDVQIVKPTAAGDTDDVTAPGDNVVGVPNDGDWPGGEHPALAIDDDTSTKYLHFKGETEPSGIKIEPLAGPTVVNGLSLTAANDAPERDPASFEIYGSNESINGPYELIASGDVVDFIGADAWPRFTKNETPIVFDNTVAYRFYQVMFPTVRDAANANSMQIAEIELLSVSDSGAGDSASSIVWVSFHEGDDVPSGNAADVGFTEAPDKAYTALLADSGYNVTRYITTGEPDADVLNAADLVIISRSVSSGNYSKDAATAWNSITAPMIITETSRLQSVTRPTRSSQESR